MILITITKTLKESKIRAFIGDGVKILLDLYQVCMWQCYPVQLIIDYTEILTNIIHKSFENPGIFVMVFQKCSTSIKESSFMHLL